MGLGLGVLRGVLGFWVRGSGTLGVVGLGWRGGTTGPWKAESTGPATRNRLLLVAKLNRMVCCVYSLELLQPGVLDTLVAVLAWVRFLRGKLEIESSTGELTGNYHACYARQG